MTTLHNPHQTGLSLPNHNPVPILYHAIAEAIVQNIVHAIMYLILVTAIASAGTALTWRPRPHSLSPAQEHASMDAGVKKLNVAPCNAFASNLGRNVHHYAFAHRARITPINPKQMRIVHPPKTSIRTLRPIHPSNHNSIGRHSPFVETHEIPSLDISISFSICTKSYWLAISPEWSHIVITQPKLPGR